MPDIGSVSGYGGNPTDSGPVGKKKKQEKKSDQSSLRDRFAAEAHLSTVDRENKLREISEEITLLQRKLIETEPESEEHLSLHSELQKLQISMENVLSLPNVNINPRSSLEDIIKQLNQSALKPDSGSIVRLLKGPES